MNITAQQLDKRTLHYLQQTADYFSTQSLPAYLVGGSVRDLLLHELGNDWDIVVKDDAALLARRLANKLGGFYAHMHEKASRVVVKEDSHEIIFDIASMQGTTIEADLATRDFTLNAMAIPLAELLPALLQERSFSLIDPFAGQADLIARRLRAVSDSVFQRDSLRLLRAVRIAMRYRLTIASQTEQLMRRDAALLPSAAPERIHDELYAILAPAGATAQLRALDSYGIFTVLFPEFLPARGLPQPPLHYWDVFEHSLETVAALERLASELVLPSEELRRSPLNAGEQDDLVEIQTLLHEAEQQGLLRVDMIAAVPMKLAALLHDIGKPATYSVDNEGAIHFYHHPQAGIPLAQEIMRRLSASTQDRRLVQQVVAHHMRPGQLSAVPLTARAIRRFFVDLGPAGINVLLISLADHLAMRGPLPLAEAWTRHLATTRLMLTRYIRERASILPPRIVQADELIHHFKLQPGPLIGQLLEHIAEAQAEGEIQSKEDAFWLAEHFFHTEQKQ
ncbi:MAG: CCA tRNA nucleotidyltransferase [Ktedonobacteraceae bacterium]|nr:CCA tRNA nucleotidyltransferase [Ktedonobacteraceae bacterium]